MFFSAAANLLANERSEFASQCSAAC